MQGAGRARTAVLVDDDDLMRSIVRRIVEDASVQVLAECGDVSSAMSSVTGPEVDMVVLDLALPGGRGEDVLAHMRRQEAPARTVVFSSYVAESDALHALGACAVVQKPDFSALEDAVSHLVLGSAPPRNDHRRPSVRAGAPLPPSADRTPSGLEPWGSFLHAVEQLEPGDAVLALDVAPGPELRETWDDVFRLDHRLAVARTASRSLRAGERISLTSVGVPVIVLPGGHPEAPAVVFDRLERTWRRDVDSVYLVGAFGHVRHQPPPGRLLERVTRLLSVERFHPEQPLRMV